MLKLTALLEKSKSRKQVNADIKILEQQINRIKLIGTFSKSATKKELNAYIKQLEGQLAVVKLQAKLDENRLKREIDSALKNVKISDIPVNEYGMGTKLRKIYVDFKKQVESSPISINFDTKKQTLHNQLTTYLAKNSKINESSILLGEADKLRDMFDNIDSRDSLKNATEQMKLFKTECSATGYATKGTTEKIGDLVKGITKVGSAFGVANLAITEYRKSLNTLKSNDTIMTEISKTSSMLTSEIEAIGEASFKTASKYGQLSSDYLTGVQEMARSGYEDLSKELGELSLLAQSAGDMTAENANNYLLATDAAYKYKGSVEKLSKALDGANFISNKNSASLTDIADAISVSASFASNAGIEIDELTAAEATMIATTKRSGSEMGRAFRSIILNLQQVSGEFDGEVIDEEQLKKVEARCHSLGVELEYMKNGVATLRDPMEVLKELAEVYNSLPDNSADKQGLISDLGGKYHSNALSSLLSRWDLYEKMLDEYSQGTNSALAEAKKTADSWEGRLNSLQNSWDSFVNSLTNKNVIKGGISFFDSTIQSAEKLIDVIGEIPLVLTTLNTALTTMNKNVGITQLINPNTNKLDIQGNFMGIDFTAIKEQKAHFEAAEGAITSWNKSLAIGKNDINKFGEEVVKNNAQLKAYLSTCSQDAPASLSGYKTYLNAAGVSTDALRLKTILLNSALSFGIGILVQLVATGVAKLIQAQDELAHETEYCKERVDGLMSSYKSALDTANSHKDSIESLAKKYEELSKGVNDFGENISLTADEYSEYNSIVNDIADMFPTMIQGYTDEGNAILKLKGNVDALREAYEAETKAAYNSLISSGEDSDGNDILEDSYNTIIKSEFGKHSWGNAGKIKYLDKVIEATNSVDDLDALWDESRNSGYMKWFEEYVTGSGSTGIKKLTPEQLAEIKQNAKILKQEYQAEINSVVDNVETLAYAYLMTHEDYDKLEEDAKTAASIMVNSLNESIVAGFGEDKANAGKYVDNIVQTILENPDAQKSMIDLFTMDTSDMSVDEIESKIDSCIKDIAKYIHEDADELKIRLGFDDSEAEPLKTKVQGFLQDAYKDKVGELTLEDLDIASKLKIPEGALLSWDELIARIEESKETLASDTSFSTIFNSSDFSEQKQSLLELAKAGELTNKALSSDDYTDFIDKLEEIGISAEEAKTEILSLLDATEKLSGASKSISSLETAYNEFKENGYVLAETIEAIPDVFRELETYDFNVFENIIGNPDSSKAQIQDAFDDLVTAYINEQGTLLDVSEEETARFISNLKEMGIVNAEEVVNATVVFKDNMEATAKEAESTAQEINKFLVSMNKDAASSTIDLTNCTWAEIQALIESGNQYGFTTSKIKEFAMQKIWANRYSLDTSADVAQLLAVAKASGIAANSISAYENASKMTEHGYGGGEAWLQSMQDSAWREVLKEIEASFSYTTPTVSYKAPTTTSSSSSSSKEAEATIETFNWVEKLLERIQARISKLDKTVSSTYRTWATRNDALLKQLTEVNTEIIAQQKAYDIYIAKANSVGLSEHYKQLVQNGDYSIEDITDDTLKQQISDYEEWYTKATECSDAIVDLKDKISELGMTHFENIFSEYEDSLSGYKHQVEMLETYIDQTESKGYVVSGNYYKELINTQKLNIKMLQEEYAKLKDSLQSSVDTGKIKPYSEAWYDMVDSIRNVQKSLEDSNSSLIEYQNNLRDLEWEAFDRLLDKISNIKDESDFLIELMSDKTMFDESGITDEGQATLGLHAINYNVYLSKADEYAKKIKEINAEIANDPNNQTLIDRRKELIELQQESILASKDEQQAMRDLISEGYDVFLESLQEIINKRKEMLDEMKDMYDYEKNISEQTQEISKLEKILKAYEGDNSEEARAKIQEYKVSLEEAKENLEETEFDRYIKNTEDMLDSLYEEAQEFVNGHLADLERLVSEVIDSTNENASNISETIKESADDVGYTISSKLTNAFDSASNGVADLVSDYNDNFLETMTTLQSTVDDIRNLIAGESNSDNLEKESNYSSDEESLSNPQDRWTQDTNGTWNYYEGGEQVKDSWTKYDKDNKWYHLDENGNMNTNQWIKNKSGTWSYVDGSGAAVTGWHKLGWTDGSNEWYNFDADGNMLENQWVDDYFVGKDGKMKTNTWIGHNGKYYWVGADGKWLDKEGWSLDYKPKDGLPIYEYAKGSKRIPEDQIALIGEMGSELYYDKSSGLIGQVGKGDMVFTNEASQKLWEFSQDPEGFMAKIGMPNLMSNFSLNMPSLSELKVPDVKPVAQNQNVTIDLGGIQMYGVNDPQEFTKQLKSAINDNSSIRKQLKDVAFGDMRGGNSFARYTR
ncbi:MAG: phage tail tape measure protein [Lachnospiraceae bacterium]|nr:phage tail tape measure protein [Lachnospiraceae bacterium]